MSRMRESRTPWRLFLLASRSPSNLPSLRKLRARSRPSVSRTSSLFSFCPLGDMLTFLSNPPGSLPRPSSLLTKACLVKTVAVKESVPRHGTGLSAPLPSRLSADVAKELQHGMRGQVRGNASPHVQDWVDLHEV